MDNSRLHYLDWLKVVIVYGILLFHVSLIFAGGGWLVNNSSRSLLLGAFAAFTFPWGIPAMFLIAGADAWFALRSHSTLSFVRARFLRLLVPLVPGLLILSPWQYFVISQPPPYHLNAILPFYLHFLQSFQPASPFGWINQHWLHLWFLAYLFAVSMACLPALLFLHRPAASRLSALALSLASHPFGLVLLAAPLVVAQVVLRPLFPSYQGWADVATYVFVFSAGALLICDRRFSIWLRRYGRFHFIFALSVSLCLGLFALLAPSNSPENPAVPLLARLTYAFLYPLYVWSWLLVVLYAGLRWLNFSHPIQVYARESVLPFYVLHHPVVITVAAFVVTLNLSLWAKFFLIVFISFPTILAIYEFGIRRWTLTRLLFGLKAKESKEQAIPASA